MVRQCAWCLRLIDSVGERISPSPLPKLYEASHGICGVCGTLWMEQVLGGLETQGSSLQDVIGREEDCSAQETITRLVLQLQRQRREVSRGDPPRKTDCPKKKKDDIHIV